MTACSALPFGQGVFRPSTPGVDILFWLKSSTIGMSDEDLKDVQKVYWALSALEASPADYRLLLKKMAADSGGE